MEQTRYYNQKNMVVKSFGGVGERSPTSLFLVFLLSSVPDLDEVDAVNTERCPEVGDDLVLGDGPVLIELADLGFGDDNLVGLDGDLESLGCSDGDLDDCLCLCLVVCDLLCDGEDVLQVVTSELVVEVDLDTSCTRPAATDMTTPCLFPRETGIPG